MTDPITPGLSYQLYSSREFPTLETTLSLLHATGYKSVEAYRGILDNQDRLNAALKATGLSMRSTHMGLDSLEEEPDWVFETIERFGLESLYVPYLDAGERPADAAGWRSFGERLGAAAEKYLTAGIDIGWHNHDFEFSPLTTGEMPMDLMLEAAPAISWQADIAWIIRGGVDPLPFLAKHKDRITAIHIKDIAPEGECTDEDGWADVGHGVVDWRMLLQAVSDSPVKHFVMEHDKPKDHHRFARRSLEAVVSWTGEKKTVTGENKND